MSFEQDYCDLFLKKRSGHMAQYVHMYRPHIYEDIINQDFYYPFKMECDLITAFADKLGEKLQGVTEVLELGPGSRTPIVSKTVPFLKALKQHTPLTRYQAIDATKEYAEQACHIIQEHFHDIQTEAFEVNFLSPHAFQKIQQDCTPKGRKLIVGFGQPIFANNTDSDIATLLKNISILLNDEDYLVFGADTNNDQNLIEAAYNADSIHELLFNVMHHLKQACHLEQFDPEAFECVFEWDDFERVVRLSLKATMDQNLSIGEQKIFIKTNHMFNILNSQKPKAQKIVEFLRAQDLTLRETISLENNQHNTFSLFIVQKTSTKIIQEEQPKFSDVA